MPMKTPPTGSGPLSVLVVENERDTADSLALVLSLHGFKVRAVYDAVAALLSAAADPPDVILTDIAMPRLDGWSLIRRVREQTVGTQPFVVVVTGYGREEDRQKSFEAGADLHFVKPVAPVELVAILNRLQKSELVGR
jgi:DNA-binding response OmpR family regulator